MLKWPVYYIWTHAVDQEESYRLYNEITVNLSLLYYV